jgi:upstream activation factor subunit UAF30
VSCTHVAGCKFPSLTLPSQVVKAIWAYIKGNNLQDPSDKRKIVCDATLRKVMGEDVVTAFSLNKYIGAHLS